MCNSYILILTVVVSFFNGVLGQYNFDFFFPASSEEDLRNVRNPFTDTTEKSQYVETINRIMELFNKENQILKEEPEKKKESGILGFPEKPDNQGFFGLKGMKGEPGIPGLDGMPGVRGYSGLRGFDGNPGKQGLIGEPGIPGFVGMPGVRGSPGLSGMKGDSGEKGERGFPGFDGLPGERGYPGNPGFDGKPGEQGMKGEPGLLGAPGLNGLPGISPTCSLCNISEALEKFNSPGQKGERGFPGIPGPRGPPGLPGKSTGLHELAILVSILQAEQALAQKENENLQHEIEITLPNLFEQKMTEQETNNLIAKVHSVLIDSLKKFKKPDGQKSSPAKSCKYLIKDYPDFLSGMYWIDPNENNNEDAFLVRCEMPNGSTCISPKSMNTNLMMCDEGDIDEYEWVTKFQNSTMFKYEANNEQIGFLQMLSENAVQELTYHCINTVAYYDSIKQNYDNAIKLLGWNDVELTAKGNPRFKYSVDFDECQNRSLEWAKTKFIYETDRPMRLPIIDVAVKDAKDSTQVFWVEIGDVCFT